MKKDPSQVDAERLARYYGCDAVVILAVDLTQEDGPKALGAAWGSDKEAQTATDGVLADMLDELEGVESEHQVEPPKGHPF